MPIKGKRILIVGLGSAHLGSMAHALARALLRHDNSILVAAPLESGASKLPEKSLTEHMRELIGSGVIPAARFPVEPLAEIFAEYTPRYRPLPAVRNYPHHGAKTRFKSQVTGTLTRHGKKF